MVNESTFDKSYLRIDVICLGPFVLEDAFAPELRNFSLAKTTAAAVSAHFMIYLIGNLICKWLFGNNFIIFSFTSSFLPIIKYEMQFLRITKPFFHLAHNPFLRKEMEQKAKQYEIVFRPNNNFICNETRQAAPGCLSRMLFEIEYLCCWLCKGNET